MANSHTNNLTYPQRVPYSEWLRNFRLLQKNREILKAKIATAIDRLNALPFIEQCLPNSAQYQKHNPPQELDQWAENRPDGEYVLTLDTNYVTHVCIEQGNPTYTDHLNPNGSPLKERTSRAYIVNTARTVLEHWKLS